MNAHCECKRVSVPPTLRKGAKDGAPGLFPGLIPGLIPLLVLWPLLWIWAMAYRPERGWDVPVATPDLTATIAGLERRIAALENAQHRPVA